MRHEHSCPSSSPCRTLRATASATARQAVAATGRMPRSYCDRRLRSTWAAACPDAATDAAPKPTPADPRTPYMRPADSRPHGKGRIPVCNAQRQGACRAGRQRGGSRAERGGQGRRTGARLRRRGRRRVGRFLRTTAGKVLLLRAMERAGRHDPPCLALPPGRLCPPRRGRGDADPRLAWLGDGARQRLDAGTGAARPPLRMPCSIP